MVSFSVPRVSSTRPQSALTSRWGRGAATPGVWRQGCQVPCRAPAGPDHQTPEGALLVRARSLALDRRARRAGAAPHPGAEAAWLPPTWRAATHPGASLAAWVRGSRRPEFCREGANQILLPSTSCSLHMCFATCTQAQLALLICDSQLALPRNLLFLYVLRNLRPIATCSYHISRGPRWDHLYLCAHTWAQMFKSGDGVFQL